MNVAPPVPETHYEQALAAVAHALGRYLRCSDEERARLTDDLAQLRAMETKLTQGRIELVVFGEISTGKSALINALVGKSVTEVDVQGGWTREAWHVPWEGCGHVVPGLAQSHLILVDTPGLNEVGGEDRARIAREAAQRADLILFVTDSDLNETEFSALVALADAHKPILVVLNKIDLYSPAQRQRLMEVIRQERLTGLVPAENVVPAAADPRELEFVIQSADGSTRSQWRKPDPDVAELKVRILEILEREGLALVALNAAMYAADKSDRVARVRVQLRDARANQVVRSFALVKSLAVAVNPVAVADVLGGSAVDATMVVTLGHIYGLEMTRAHAQRLVSSIAKAAGWVLLGEALTSVSSSLFKALTLGYGTVLTALPQGLAAGYGSYIVGQAAKFYFEHGASWGGHAPKTVVQRILDETDKPSVLEHLKDELKKKLQRNIHADTPPR
jgi:hypothetical protein